MNLKSISLITRNDEMRSIISRIDKVVNTPNSILLIGETGVGKELFAEYIHKSGDTVNAPFVKISLSAMPSELMENELFGHERGAYTSAAVEKKGLFEIASGGSIFLDDIDDVPLQIQTKLLRVLEESELLRVGGTKPIKISLRVITATKKDLKELVSKGIFRSDLYYRINVVPIRIPPLRERKEDIEILAEHFLKRFFPGRSVKLSNETLKLLVDYSWPGNVRELRNLLQRIPLFTGDEILPGDLPPEIRNENPIEYLINSCNDCYVNGNLNFDQTMNCLEYNLLNNALNKTNGNQSKASKMLGLSLSTFRDKLKKHNIQHTNNHI
jgi:transcriptional regulator with GAF, ATPase, and Fis domain